MLDRKYMDLLCPDGIHPNEQGHMLMAKVVENIIEKVGKRKIKIFSDTYGVSLC